MHKLNGDVLRQDIINTIKKTQLRPLEDIKELNADSNQDSESKFDLKKYYFYMWY